MKGGLGLLLRATVWRYRGSRRLGGGVRGFTIREEAGTSGLKGQGLQAPQGSKDRVWGFGGLRLVQVAQMLRVAIRVLYGSQIGFTADLVI